MKVSFLRKQLSKIPPNANILIFPTRIVDDDNNEILPGIGYYDYETSEIVYIGEANVVSEDEIDD